MNEQANGKLTGRHVAIFIGGMFAVVLAMNITFITLALNSFAGEDVENPFARGLAYNEILEDRAAQQELGWSASIETNAFAGQNLSIRLTLNDHVGQPIEDASIEALLRRPTNDGVDQVFVFVAVGDGVYEGRATLPLPGVWDLRIDASQGTDHLEIEERLWLE